MQAKKRKRRGPPAKEAFSDVMAEFETMCAGKDIDEGLQILSQSDLQMDIDKGLQSLSLFLYEKTCVAAQQASDVANFYNSPTNHRVLDVAPKVVLYAPTNLFSQIKDHSVDFSLAGLQLAWEYMFTSVGEAFSTEESRSEVCAALIERFQDLSKLLVLVDDTQIFDYSPTVLTEKKVMYVQKGFKKQRIFRYVADDPDVLGMHIKYEASKLLLKSSNKYTFRHKPKLYEKHTEGYALNTLKYKTDAKGNNPVMEDPDIAWFQHTGGVRYEAVHSMDPLRDDALKFTAAEEIVAKAEFDGLGTFWDFWDEGYDKGEVFLCDDKGAVKIVTRADEEHLTIPFDIAGMKLPALRQGLKAANVKFLVNAPKAKLQALLARSRLAQDHADLSDLDLSDDTEEYVSDLSDD